MENVIKQTMTWPGMHAQIKQLVKNYHICQLSKQIRRNYSHLLPKKAHYKPCQEVHVDCTGPYAVNQLDPNTRKVKELHLSCMIMIDPVTR